MTLTKDFASRFEQCLRGLDLDGLRIRVYPADRANYRYFASVVSDTFEGKDEAWRQSQVWGRILDSLDDADQRRVEFVYTDAPSERPDLVTTP